MTDQICPCSRCGRPCRVGPPPNPDARLLRRATAPSGYCAGCAATQWLKTTDPIAGLIEARGPEMLRNEIVRNQFGAILRSGMSDATLAEIDWEAVVANWSLPVAGEKKARRQMGLDF